MKLGQLENAKEFLDKAKEVDANDEQLKKEFQELEDALMYERLLVERSASGEFDSCVM